MAAAPDHRCRRCGRLLPVPVGCPVKAAVLWCLLLVAGALAVGVLLDVAFWHLFYATFTPTPAPTFTPVQLPTI